MFKNVTYSDPILHSFTQIHSDEENVLTFHGARHKLLQFITDWAAWLELISGFIPADRWNYAQANLVSHGFHQFAPIFHMLCCTQALSEDCKHTLLLVVLFPNSVPVITALFTGPFTMFASKRIYCGWKSHSDAPFSSERTSLTNRLDSDVSLVSCLVFQMIRDKRVLSPCRGIVLTQRYLKGFFFSCSQTCDVWLCRIPLESQRESWKNWILVTKEECWYDVASTNQWFLSRQRSWISVETCPVV